MNSANFHEYLRNPSMLHQVNYQELKSLVLQYPFSTNLRYLMLIKSLLDGKREYDRNLILASLSSIDRRKLKQLVEQYSHLSESKDNYAITEEFLELKDLSTLEEVLEAGGSAQPAPQAAAADLPTVDSGFEFLDDLTDTTTEKAAEAQGEEAPTDDSTIPELEDLLEQDLSESEDIPIHDDGLDELFQMDKPLVNRPKEKEADNEDLEIEESIEGLFDAPLEEEIEVVAEAANGEAATEGEEPLETLEDIAEAAPSDEAVVDSSDVPLEITNDEDQGEEAPVEPAPTPKSTFNSYKKRFQPKRPGLLSGDLEVLPKEEKTTKPASIPNDTPLEEEYQEPENVATDMAAKSVDEDQNIATETLAKVLAMQGHFDKAIKMYEKLSLQFPEKSDTFAAKIEELKNK